MIIISVFLLMSVVGFLFIQFLADGIGNDLFDFLALTFTFSGLTLLILSLMAVFFFRQLDHTLIQRHADLKERYNQGDTDPEHRIAIYGRVIDMNGYVKEVQFSARSPLTNWFHDPAVLDLKPIQ